MIRANLSLIGAGWLKTDMAIPTWSSVLLILLITLEKFLNGLLAMPIPLLILKWTRPCGVILLLLPLAWPSTVLILLLCTGRGPLRVFRNLAMWPTEPIRRRAWLDSLTRISIQLGTKCCLDAIPPLCWTLTILLAGIIILLTRLLTFPLVVVRWTVLVIPPLKPDRMSIEH